MTVPSHLPFQSPESYEGDSWELNKWIYGRIAPSQDDGRWNRAAWNKTVKATVLKMAETPNSAEFKAFLAQVLPTVDVSRLHLKPEMIIKRKGRDRNKDERLGTRIPNPKLLRQRGPAPAPILPVMMALMVSSGDVEQFIPNTQVRVRCSLRQIGEIIGKAHQRAYQLIVSYGEDSQHLVRYQTTNPRDLAKKRGVNPYTGGRRGAESNLPTEYQFIVSSDALEMAHEYVRVHGYPQVTWPAEPITELQPYTQHEADAALTEWKVIRQQLMALAIHQARIDHLLAGLEPVCLQGRTLTLAGSWHHMALQLLELVTKDRLNIRLILRQ